MGARLFRVLSRHLDDLGERSHRFERHYTATLVDPTVYTRPWRLSVLLHRHREPNFQLIENYCYTLDYDKFYPVPVGQ